MADLSKKEESRLRREFERQRRALQKALPKSIKQLSRGTGWKNSRGILFRESSGWFVHVGGIPWVAETKTEVEFHAKPMKLDPVFWDIVELPENASLPLSFRYFGAWTCRTPDLFKAELLGEGESDDLATAIIDWADAKLGEFQMLNWKDSEFSKFIEGNRNQTERGAYMATLVSVKILMGDFVAALNICERAIENREVGGFSIGGRDRGTFPELALDWIEKQRRGRILN